MSFSVNSQFPSNLAGKKITSYDIVNSGTMTTDKLIVTESNVANVKCHTATFYDGMYITSINGNAFEFIIQAFPQPVSFFTLIRIRQK